MLEDNLLEVVKAHRCRERNSNHYGQLIGSTKSALNSFQLWQVEQIKRNANRVAHRLAKEFLLQLTDRILRGCAPQFIHDLIIECVVSDDS